MLASYVEKRIVEVSKKFPPILSDTKHKGSAGRICVIGGSPEYTGAPYFAGMSSLKCGGDLVYIFCTKDAAKSIKSYAPELIVLPYLDSENGCDLITARLSNMHSIVIGPGLGENEKVHSLIASAIRNVQSNSKIANLPMIFDADGISFVSKNMELINKHIGQVYLTPNINELGKLSMAYLGSKTIDIENANALRNLLGKVNEKANLVIKGKTDKIICHNGFSECSTTGSPRRIGGQGDILSGSLGLFAYWAELQSQNVTCLDEIPPNIVACYAACSITRTCNNLAFEKRKRSMLTSDMLNEIGPANENFFN